jgi:hypothetical protein
MTLPSASFRLAEACVARFSPKRIRFDAVADDAIIGGFMRLDRKRGRVGGLRCSWLIAWMCEALV